eukprot:scaffold2580_cov46-Phaeocystis_antarctica.AAC.3
MNWKALGGKGFGNLEGGAELEGVRGRVRARVRVRVRVRARVRVRVARVAGLSSSGSAPKPPRDARKFLASLTKSSGAIAKPVAWCVCCVWRGACCVVGSAQCTVGSEHRRATQLAFGREQRRLVEEDRGVEVVAWDHRGAGTGATAGGATAGEAAAAVQRSHVPAADCEQCDHHARFREVACASTARRKSGGVHNLSSPVLSRGRLPRTEGISIAVSLPLCLSVPPGYGYGGGGSHKGLAKANAKFEPK